MSLPPRVARPLDCVAPVDAGRLIIDLRPDGGVTITVPTRRRCISRIAVGLGEPLALLFLPLIWLVYQLLASREPRAVLCLTSEEFMITERSDDGLGYWPRSRSWPHASLSNLRPNHYVNGLYLRVAGKENLDLLTDLPAPEIAAIGVALEAAGQRLAARDMHLPTEAGS
jgi:hypothetical protein